MEAAELVGDSEGSSVWKLLTLPSRLLHETRREALLGGAADGDGAGDAPPISVRQLFRALNTSLKEWAELNQTKTIYGKAQLSLNDLQFVERFHAILKLTTF